MSTIRFRCDKCQQLFKVGAEKAGRRVKCVKCQAIVQVPADEEIETLEVVKETLTETVDSRPKTKRTQPADPPPETESSAETEEEEVRPRRKTSKKAAWRKVRIGLILLLIGVGLQLLFTVLGQLSGRLFTPSLQSFSWQIRIFIILGIVQTVLELAGWAFCLFVPGDSSARTLGITILVVGGAGVAATAGMFLDPLVRLTSLQTEIEKAENINKMSPEERDKWLADSTTRAEQSLRRISLLALGLSILQYARLILIPFYLKTVASVLRSREQEDAAESLLKISTAIVGIGFLTTVALKFLPLSLFSLLTPLGLLSTGLNLAWSVLYLILLVNLQRAVTDKIS